MGKISFHNADIKFIPTAKLRIKKIIQKIFEEESINWQFINCIFCSDNYLLALNKKYLNHDFFTDIITFQLLEIDRISGELYISIDRVKENAKTYKIKYQTELRRVIIHGTLHLCGYNDKTRKQQLEIRQKEEYYLKLGFT